MDVHRVVAIGVVDEVPDLGGVDDGLSSRLPGVEELRVDGGERVPASIAPSKPNSNVRSGTGSPSGVVVEILVIGLDVPLLRSTPSGGSKLVRRRDRRVDDELDEGYGGLVDVVA